MKRMRRAGEKEGSGVKERRRAEDDGWSQRGGRS